MGLVRERSQVAGEEALLSTLKPSAFCGRKHDRSMEEVMGSVDIQEAENHCRPCPSLTGVTLAGPREGAGSGF